MRYIAGKNNDQFSGIVEQYVNSKGFILDRKLYSYYLIYKPSNDGHNNPDGAMIYSDYTGYSITMDVYIENCVYKEVISLMFQYPFDDLMVKNLYGTIESDNTSSRRFFEELGCTVVACIPDFYGPGNDRLVYWTNRENIYRWIR